MLFSLYPGCLKLTPMRLANVPPPMALHEIEISSNIIDVSITIRSNPRPRAIIGVLHHQGYSQFEWSLFSMIQKLPVCKFTHGFWSTESDTIKNRDRLYLQVSFSGNKSLLYSKSTNESTLTVTGEDGGHMGQIFLHGTDLEGIIRETWTSSSKTYIMLDQVGKINSEESENRAQRLREVDTTGTELTLSPVFTQRVDAILCSFETEHAVNALANGTEKPATKDIIFSLAENGSLFANDRLLARNCTSFLVTPAHLIYTTSQHLLKFVHLTGGTEGEFLQPEILAPCSNSTFNRPRDTS